MIANHIDALIPNWQMDPGDQHRVRVRAIILYALNLSPEEFETALAHRGQRLRTIQARLPKIQLGKRQLTVIDGERIETLRKRQRVSAASSYLDRFMFDTEKTAIRELAEVIPQWEQLRIATDPANPRLGITVTASRSFRCMEDLKTFEKGQATDWRPCVRLTVDIAFQGTMEAVETCASSMRDAMMFAGPITSFEVQALPLDLTHASAVADKLKAI